MNEERELLPPEAPAAPDPAARPPKKRRTLPLSTCIVVTLLAVLATATVMALLMISTIRHTFAGDRTVMTIRQAVNVIRSDFVGQVTDDELQTQAIQGLVDATGDKWSYYVPVSGLQEFQDNRNNSYVGIGVTVREAEGRFMVVSVLPGSSALEAGLNVGDELLSADGTPFAGLTMEDMRSLVVGEEGTFVEIGVRRPDGSEGSYRLERRRTAEVIAESRMIGDVGYVKLANFNSGARDALVSQAQALLDQGAVGLVIDLRNNPGGFLTELIGCLDHFLPAGVRFISRNAQGAETVERTDRDGPCLAVPVAVLVNENTYSAAEYFAAALQEYGRGTVVGVRTPGKGRAQTPHYLLDGSCIVLSTVEYVTPNGVSIAETGITPDSVVPLTPEETLAVAYGQVPDEEDPQLQAALAAVG